MYSCNCGFCDKCTDLKRTKIRLQFLLMGRGKMGNYDDKFIEENVKSMSNNTITTALRFILTSEIYNKNYSMLRIIIDNLSRDLYKAEWEYAFDQNDIVALNILRTKQEPQTRRGVYFSDEHVHKYNYWINTRNIGNELKIKFFTGLLCDNYDISLGVVYALHHIDYKSNHINRYSPYQGTQRHLLN